MKKQAIPHKVELWTDTVFMKGKLPDLRIQELYLYIVQDLYRKIYCGIDCSSTHCSIALNFKE
jgi:hypothetical protein